jgi:gluconokinase
MLEPDGRTPPAGKAAQAASPVEIPGTSVLVVMGVSGVGKTTIGMALAERLGWEYQEGDSLHSPENVAKMHSGVPLTDDDRWPWLGTVAELIDRWRAEGGHGVVTCSALKRAYRRILVGDRPDVRLVHLTAPELLIGSRLAARKGHYMPAGLLRSQIDTLEVPGPDERPITVPVGEPVEAIVGHALAALGVRTPGGGDALPAR